MDEEFDGRLYSLSYVLPDGEKVVTEATGAKRLAASAASHAFHDPRVVATSRGYQQGFEERLVRTPVGTNVHDTVTQCVFRIDVLGPLPSITIEEI